MDGGDFVKIELRNLKILISDKFDRVCDDLLVA